jgi:hypothetical protein
VVNILFYLDLITLVVNPSHIRVSWRPQYSPHLIDLNFKPKYDKCDGPDMNTIKLNYMN